MTTTSSGDRQKAGTPASAAFAGAAQADDYEEDVVTRTRGSRPRRSATAIQPLVPVHDVDFERPATVEVEADRGEPLPRTMRSEPVVSALLTGGAGLLPHSTDSQSHPLARSGTRGLLNQVGFRLRPGAQEQAELERARVIDAARARIRQATWTRAVSVLVANPKGGTGKTPLALLLGGTLASIRGGSVAVIEVADDPGALAYRAEGEPRLGVGDLVRDADTIRTAGQLAGYTAPQTSFAAVIGSVGLRPRLDAAAVEAMVTVIDDHYSIRVMDSGNQPTSSAFQGAIARADVLVIPVVNAGDSTLEAVRMLDGLRAAGGRSRLLAKQPIVARLTDGRPESTAINDEVARIMTAAGAATICDLPFDPHIAERGQLTLGRLAPATIDAFTRLADSVIHMATEQAAHNLKGTR